MSCLFKDKKGSSEVTSQDISEQVLTVKTQTSSNLKNQ